ncbi:glycosyl hydrolase, partial [Vibrio parahaemolyticus]
RADIPVQELIQYIRRVRAEVKVPVSTAEPWAYWLLYPELAGEVDFIAIHLLPYWEGIATKDALDEALSRYQQVKNAFPNKPVVIA